jgi:hypothetical protein
LARVLRDTFMWATAGNHRGSTVRDRGVPLSSSRRGTLGCCLGRDDVAVQRRSVLGVFRPVS